MKRWYVYRVNVDGALGYIGKGSGDRYLQSAKRLNGIAGVIQDSLTEKSAFRLEIRLISQFKPRFNKTKGGEGASLTPEEAGRRIEARWTQEAYDRADKTKGCLSVLLAACFARSELNSRGIKWPVEGQDQEPEDQKAAEAVRRLNAWQQLKLQASRLWNISLD